MESTLKTRKISHNLKSDLLKIARELIKSDGLDGFDIRKLVKAANCSVGTFYNHYKGLHDLIIHINGETVDRFGEYVLHDIDSKDLPKEIIRKICLNYITYAKDNHSEWLLLLEYPVNMELPEWYQLKIDQLFKKVSHIFHPILRGPKKHTDRAVKVLWGSLHGICSLILKDKLRFHHEQDTLELCQELFHNYILGYRIGLGIT